MKRAIIFANGKLGVIPEIISDLHSSDLIIAADGGAQHCKSLGIKPDVIIGDLDSLDPEEVNAYQVAGVNIFQYPTHKDKTDLELALQYILKNNVTEAIIIGALGARWDMSLTNILLITQTMFSEIKIRLLYGSQELTLLRGGAAMDILARNGHQISLIPLKGDAYGVTTQGLEYPLNDETLIFGSSRGVSNVILQDHARVFVREGQLMCILNGEVR